MSMGRTVFVLFGIVVVAGIIATIVSLVLIFGFSNDYEENDPINHVWGYKCEERLCVRTKISPASNATMGLAACRMSCGDDIGTVWPLPSVKVEFNREITSINVHDMSLTMNDFIKQNNGEHWTSAWSRFKSLQTRKIPRGIRNLAHGKRLVVRIQVDKVPTDLEDIEFNYDTNERYELKISESANSIEAAIECMNFYGARHALETLSQVIVYDELHTSFVTMSSVEIVDEPKFRHRGISMDTSRNFYPIESIKRVIDGMAMVKLNIFHWHITDSQSWPLVVESQLELSETGAYAPNKVYTPCDIREIVKYARSRGVRVVPELDAPAHVGEGWQFKDDLLTCFNALPWVNYCYQPPCGQFNPSKAQLYDILEDVYREMMENFQPAEFHMGGDEIRFACWNTSESLKTWMAENEMQLDDAGFMKLWNYFQSSALERLDRVSSGKKLPIILWSSTLTELPYLTEYLDKERYIVQVWSWTDDPKITTILENGYKIVVSNYDKLYLDCGWASWYDGGFNWCKPYKTWQGIYDNRMEVIAGSYVDQVHGAEVTIWSEQIDEFNLESRLWPRAAALAERLWSNPSTTWAEAERRMVMNRQTLIEVGGLKADRLQPEWCRQYEDVCPMRFE